MKSELPDLALKALEALIDGNERFKAGASTQARQDPARRSEVAEGQHPRAAIVGCSDSRVAPEIVFDQGLGDVFVVRTAGNLVDQLGVESLEYAAAHLGVPLIVVMGHSRCGAVEAAARGTHGRPSAIQSALAPSLEAAKGRTRNRLDAAARENARMIAAALESREGVLKGLVDEGSLHILGAFYDIERGTVEFFSHGDSLGAISEQA
ncbi:MAG: carbonic anhydrase [Candidatus Krumholzibacteria bacterium]|nr:carbonic anhydrase [Candidatus Krumholzibacteria bacterium]